MNLSPFCWRGKGKCGIVSVPFIGSYPTHLGTGGDLVSVLALLRCGAFSYRLQPADTLKPIESYLELWR